MIDSTQLLPIKKGYGSFHAEGGRGWRTDTRKEIGRPHGAGRQREEKLETKNREEGERKKHPQGWRDNQRKSGEEEYLGFLRE